MTFDVVRLDETQAGEVLTLQRAAYVPEAQRYRDPDLPPLVETLDELAAALRSPSVVALGVRLGHRLVGAVRLRLADDVAHLGRLVVAPDRQGQGIGSALLTACAELHDAVLRFGSHSGAHGHDHSMVEMTRGLGT